MNLALFDFDGTITKHDTFIGFMRYAVGRRRFNIGLFVLSPVFIASRFKFISISKAKQIFFTYFFKGREKSEFEKIALRYSNTIIPQIIRPEALEKIKWHKSQGDEIAVVSASFDSWLKSWCNEYALDLICSKFEVKNGLVTGKFQGNDCIGIEKVRRIKEKYNIKQYHTIYAYGDSDGDKEMLDLADVKYYRWEMI